MRFAYSKQDFRTLERAQENTFLLTDGLGGYSSMTAAFSVTRCDQGVLVGALSSPNVRATLVHRLSERLSVGDWQTHLSTQGFWGKQASEEGYKHLTSFVHEFGPTWMYMVRNVQVVRRVGMARDLAATVVYYEIDNRGDEPCTLTVAPYLLMAPKGEARAKKTRLSLRGGAIRADGYCVHMRTTGEMRRVPVRWERLAYPDDAKDGRTASGLCGCCCEAEITVPPMGREIFSIVFSMEDRVIDAKEVLMTGQRRMKYLIERSGIYSPVGQELVCAADAFFSRKDATGERTLLAGFPLFGDWGRDTMIAILGCALTTRRFSEAKSILRSFLAFERDGLVPNLFPEGGAQPMYNTADAALLLINAVHEYVEKAMDPAFLTEAWPVMVRIVKAYARGTAHGIRMDEDGLITAGEGLDQVTWMDVRVGEILPTPRHGKPVEINAYWYNALRIMQERAREVGENGARYGEMAERTKKSFIEKFYMEDKGYLRDVLSGTAADEQIRCNQIWAVTMPYTMLEPDQARRVVQTVGKHLYTPSGLRTLSPEDPQYRGTYGGPQLERDLAYHQGTAWVFPLGAYYMAVLKTAGGKTRAVRDVTMMLSNLEGMLREGCVGQLPEIYDGDNPGASKGCYAQAWSVGEMLRALAMLESYTREIRNMMKVLQKLNLPAFDPEIGEREEDSDWV